MLIHMTFVHCCLEPLKYELINTRRNGKPGGVGLILWWEELSPKRELYTQGRYMSFLPETLLPSLPEWHSISLSKSV